MVPLLAVLALLLLLMMVLHAGVEERSPHLLEELKTLLDRFLVALCPLLRAEDDEPGESTKPVQVE